MIARVSSRGVVVSMLLATTCDRPREPVASGRAASTCPPCECVCDCGKEGVAKAEPATDVAELVTTATRKMNHGDGKGCLADLDAIKAIDAKMDERLAVTRGQCEMLAGDCQAGKKRVAQWYEVEAAMTPDRAEITAEQLASMRCRGGDANDRDTLLAALFNLSDGAYMNTRDVAFCRENVDVAKRLIPLVKPTGPDDTQVSGGAQALFYTAASCYARAGDCKEAFKVYSDLFPSSGLSAIPDPAQRTKIIRDSFDSGITRCTGKVP